MYAQFDAKSFPITTKARLSRIMAIKITSDSTCDLSPALVEEYNIGIVPLTVMKDGEPFKDGVEITPADIFAFTASTGKLCSTSAVGEYEYADYFRPWAEENDAVIHINISAEFSSCYQNACAAAKHFKNVYVVDSRNLSSGQGHVVIEAAQLAAKGDMSPEDICRALNDLTPRVEASFLLDRLDYMVKGGRCSSVAALGANLLKLKPCIEVIDGKMRVVKKYRGAYNHCIQAYVTERIQGRTDLRRDRMFITHAAAEPDTLSVARQAVAENGRFEHVYETNAGCTVTCHCGPHTLGVLFIRTK